MKPRNSRALSTKKKRYGAATNTSGRCGNCSARVPHCRRTFWIISTGRRRSGNVARCVRSGFSAHEDYEAKETHRIPDFERAQSEGRSEEHTSELQSLRHLLFPYTTLFRSAGMSRGACGRVFPPMKTMKPKKPIESLILNVRSQKVILDADLAELYDVPTKVFNQAVKRNADRFPEDFRSEEHT